MNAIVNRHQLRQKIGKRAAEQPKSPETEPNYKAISYKTIKAQYDELKESCQDKDEQLNQAQQDADEMAVK
ncbi:unnamed protein product [Pocillopora meandrina]|uniref:Tubulin-specific chaperone A n=1 Tax=Pocillopora meandrina TaxID=46732 RepID=A0AAU9WZY9_9CNID|nr:unnamed protein product [Pocillopora meandrina]